MCTPLLAPAIFVARGAMIWKYSFYNIVLEVGTPSVIFIATNVCSWPGILLIEFIFALRYKDFCCGGCFEGPRDDFCWCGSFLNSASLAYYH